MRAKIRPPPIFGKIEFYKFFIFLKKGGKMTAIFKIHPAVKNQITAELNTLKDVKIICFFNPSQPRSIEEGIIATGIKKDLKKQYAFRVYRGLCYLFEHKGIKEGANE